MSNTIWTKKEDPNIKLRVDEAEAAFKAELKRIESTMKDDNDAIRVDIGRLRDEIARLRDDLKLTNADVANLEKIGEESEAGILKRLDDIEKPETRRSLDGDKPLEESQLISPAYVPWSKRKAARVTGSQDIEAMKKRILKVSPPPAAQ